MVQVAICSPLPALRAGLKALVSADPDIHVTVSAPSLSGLPALAPEVQVLIATPGGIDLRQAEGLPPDLAVLLVSEDAEELQALAGLELRAWGAISPDSAAEALQAGVHALAEGLVVVSPGLYRRLGELPLRSMDGEAGEDAGGPVEALTAREGEVLRALAQGLTNKQIALALQISEHTVKFHVSSIYSKLGVTNRAEAVRKGARKGLVPL